MADADARATARRHTAQLLKMLRGYGPTAEPEPAVPLSILQKQMELLSKAF